MRSKAVLNLCRIVKRPAKIKAAKGFVFVTKRKRVPRPSLRYYCSIINVRFRNLFVSVGKGWTLVRFRTRMHARMPESNDNVKMTLGHKVIVDAVFKDTGLDVFLDGLKRDQGSSVAAETVALVANSVEMTGISVNRIDRMLDNDAVRDEYGPESNAAHSICRTVDRLGENFEGIVEYLAEILKRGYGLRMQTVFMDWTSLFFEAPQQGIVRAGYSRDHRPDRPQVTIELSMDRATGMPVGLTVNAGNILDVSHFEDAFEQIRPLSPNDAMIVFDNGA